MDSTRDITVGQVVKSRAGRDAGNMFIVFKIVDDKYVLIVDGDTRPLEKPKKKKVKHLIVHNTVLPEFKEKIDGKVEINNAYVRKLLEPFKESC